MPLVELGDYSSSSLRDREELTTVEQERNWWQISSAESLSSFDGKAAVTGVVDQHPRTQLDKLLKGLELGLAWE